MSTTKIKCPNCGEAIDVQDVLAHQLEVQIQQKYQNDLAQVRQQMAEKETALAMARAEFEDKKQKENELFKEKLEKQLQQDRQIIEAKLKQKVEQEQAERYGLLQKELNEKSLQLKELNRTKAEIERLKREKDEVKEAVEAAAQKKLNEQILAERERIKRAEEEKNELKFRELIKQLEDQKKLTEEMKRKQEQGSMQLQGEVQELAIEEWLTAKFPLDTITEIKKGARGGDCIQVVHTRTKQNCGRIYYESKRTKDFSSAWIGKFKNDMREHGADVGVLVTQAMPPELDRMGLLDGVWICTFDEFKGLCAVLRETVVKLSDAAGNQEHKGDKMHMLYDFLTGTTFRMQVEAIVEAFTSLQSALDSEKRAMQRIWKEREKQIGKVMDSTIDMYGSIKGIAGNAVQEVRALQLGDGDLRGLPLE
ncbi:MAG: DUF2130 domain-containing protein [Bacteroidetes bacterium]|jgi:hypothetical protein|nr:DUF2130 domain-containing protein [Bacteroidota bacterium]